MIRGRTSRGQCAIGLQRGYLSGSRLRGRLLRSDADPPVTLPTGHPLLVEVLEQRDGVFTAYPRQVLEIGYPERISGPVAATQLVDQGVEPGGAEDELVAQTDQFPLARMAIIWLSLRARGRPRRRAARRNSL